MWRIPKSCGSCLIPSLPRGINEPGQTCRTQPNYFVSAYDHQRWRWWFLKVRITWRAGAIVPRSAAFISHVHCSDFNSAPSILPTLAKVPLNQWCDAEQTSEFCRGSALGWFLIFSRQWCHPRTFLYVAPVRHKWSGHVSHHKSAQFTATAKRSKSLD